MAFVFMMMQQNPQSASTSKFFTDQELQGLATQFFTERISFFCDDYYQKHGANPTVEQITNYVNELTCREPGFQRKGQPTLDNLGYWLIKDPGNQARYPSLGPTDANTEASQLYLTPVLSDTPGYSAVFGIRSEADAHSPFERIRAGFSGMVHLLSYGNSIEAAYARDPALSKLSELLTDYKTAKSSSQDTAAAREALLSHIRANPSSAQLLYAAARLSEDATTLRLVSSADTIANLDSQFDLLSRGLFNLGVFLKTSKMGGVTLSYSNQTRVSPDDIASEKYATKDLRASAESTYTDFPAQEEKNRAYAAGWVADPKDIVLQGLDSLKKELIRFAQNNGFPQDKQDALVSFLSNTDSLANSLLASSNISFHGDWDTVFKDSAFCQMMRDLKDPQGHPLFPELAGLSDKATASKMTAWVVDKYSDGREKIAYAMNYFLASSTMRLIWDRVLLPFANSVSSENGNGQFGMAWSPEGFSLAHDLFKKGGIAQGQMDHILRFISKGESTHEGSGTLGDWYSSFSQAAAAVDPCLYYYRASTASLTPPDSVAHLITNDFRVNVHGPMAADPHQDFSKVPYTYDHFAHDILKDRSEREQAGTATDLFLRSFNQLIPSVDSTGHYESSKLLRVAFVKYDEGGKKVVSADQMTSADALAQGYSEYFYLPPENKDAYIDWMRTRKTGSGENAVEQTDYACYNTLVKYRNTGLFTLTPQKITLSLDTANALAKTYDESTASVPLDYRIDVTMLSADKSAVHTAVAPSVYAPPKGEEINASVSLYSPYDVSDPGRLIGHLSKNEHPGEVNVDIPARDKFGTTSPETAGRHSVARSLSEQFTATGDKQNVEHFKFNVQMDKTDHYVLYANASASAGLVVQYAGTQNADFVSWENHKQNPGAELKVSRTRPVEFDVQRVQGGDIRWYPVNFAGLNRNRSLSGVDVELESGIHTLTLPDGQTAIDFSASTGIFYMGLDGATFSPSASGVKVMRTQNARGESIEPSSMPNMTPAANLPVVLAGIGLAGNSYYLLPQSPEGVPLPLAISKTTSEGGFTQYELSDPQTPGVVLGTVMLNARNEPTKISPNINNIAKYDQFSAFLFRGRTSANGGLETPITARILYDKTSFEYALDKGSPDFITKMAEVKNSLSSWQITLTKDGKAQTLSLTAQPVAGFNPLHPAYTLSYNGSPVFEATSKDGSAFEVSPLKGAAFDSLMEEISPSPELRAKYADLKDKTPSRGTGE